MILYTVFKYDYGTFGLFTRRSSINNICINLTGPNMYFIFELFSMKLQEFVKIKLETSVIHQSKAEFMQNFIS